MSLQRPTCPKELPGGSNCIPGAQKTPSGSFRAVILLATWHFFSDIRSLFCVDASLRTSGLQSASAGDAKRKQLIDVIELIWELIKLIQPSKNLIKLS